MYLHKLLAVSPILHALAAAAATGAGPAADHGAGVTNGDSSIAERYMVDPDHTPPDYFDPMAERKGICLFESQECVIGETVLPCIHNEQKSRQCHKTGETCWALGLPPFDSALCGGRRPMRKPGLYPYGKPKPHTTSLSHSTTTFERYYPTTGPNSTKISVSFQTWPNSGPVHTKAAVQERDSAHNAILPTPEEAARLEQARRERVALLRSQGMNTTMAIEECVEKEMIHYSEEQQASDIPDRLPIRIAEAMVRDSCAWDINHPKTTHSAEPTQKTQSPAKGEGGINQYFERIGTIEKHKTHLPRDPESARHRHGRPFKTSPAIEKCVRETMERESEEAGRHTPMDLTPLWEAEADARMECRKKLEPSTSTHSAQSSQSTGVVTAAFYRFGKGPFVPATEVKSTKETDSPLPEEYFGRGPEMLLPESEIREPHEREPVKYRHGKYGKFRSTPQIEECVRKGVEQALNDEKEFAWSPRMHVKSTAAYQREICRELLDPAHQAPVAELPIASRPDEIHVKRNATTAAKSKSKGKNKDKSKDKGKGKAKSKPKTKSRAKKLKEKEIARLAAKKAAAQRKAEKARIAALEKATHDRSHADMNKWEDAQLHDAKRLKKTTHPREACIDQYIAAQLGNPERAPYINRENIDVVRKNARKHCKNYLQGFGWDKGEKIPPGAYYDGRPKVAMPGPGPEGKGVDEGDVGKQVSQ